MVSVTTELASQLARTEQPNSGDPGVSGVGVGKVLELKSLQGYSERLSAISHFSATVASHINDYLTPIICYSQLLSQSDLPPNSLRKLERILEASKRASEIVHGMLDFSGEQSGIFEKVNLNRVASEAADMSRGLLELEDDRIELSLEEEAPFLNGDPGQIVQALLHLIRNAFDSTQAENRLINVRTYFDGEGWSVLEVEDNGAGISQTILPKVLMPFFTTHPEGHAGLGLSIVNGIVEGHGGQLEIHTVPEKGTKITLSFPPFRDDDSEAREKALQE